MSVVTRRGLLWSSLTVCVASGLGFGRALHAAGAARGGGATAVLFASRYGATGDTARWIAAGMGAEVAVIDVTQGVPAEGLDGFRHLVVGSGVWTGGVHPVLRDLVATQAPLLREKLLAAFVVCGTEATSPAAVKRIDGYLGQITGPLDAPSLPTAHFGGRLVVEKLTEHDRRALTAFYRTTAGKELESWDHTAPAEARSFGATLAGASADAG